MRETAKTILFLTLVCTIIFLPICKSLGSIPNQDRSIDLNSVVAVKPFENSIFDRQLVNSYFPTGLTPTTDQTALIMQLQTGFESRFTEQFFNGEFFKKTSVGKIANQIQEASRPEFTFKPLHGPPQKFDFRYQPIEQTAIINYSGYCNSSVVYNLAQNSVAIGISKKLDTETTLSFSNTSPAGQFSPNGNLTLTYTF